MIAAIKALKPVEHPVVRINLDSGRKCIFMHADFTRRIVGVDRHEAKSVLHFLLDWMKRPEFMVHHRWEAGGIAIWDNRSTQHYVVANYWSHDRVNQRFTFDTPADAAQTGAKQPSAQAEKIG